MYELSNHATKLLLENQQNSSYLKKMYAFIILKSKFDSQILYRVVIVQIWILETIHGRNQGS